MMVTISLKMGGAYDSAAAKKLQNREDWLSLMAAGTFLFAIGALVVFVIKNL
jgi:hypothetical protein